MKPRTKNEIIVDKLSKSLPDVSATQFKWVRSHLFDNNGYYNKGEVWCSCCGHTFKADKCGNKAVCPMCGNTLTIKDSRKQNVNEWHYFTILTTCKGWQVVRNFKVTKRGTRTTAKTADVYYMNDGGVWCKSKTEGDMMTYEFHEVTQAWYNNDGEQVIMGVGKVAFSSFQEDVWRHEPMSIKHGDNYIFSGHVVYPRIKLLPKLKRNGFKLIDECQPAVIRALLCDIKAEIIFKVGYYGLFERVCKGYINMSKEGRWDAFKICMRNHYTLDGYESLYHNKWCDYFDYIDNLVELGKDVHNAYYACPADFKKAHDTAMHKVYEIREQKRLEEQRKKAIAEEDKYKKAKGKYLGLDIVGKGICIMPLQCIDDFYHEGKALHHCVFANKYYEKENSLILTAREYIGGKRLETIEIDLNTFTIIQSRGLNNLPSDRHDDIVKLMNDNMSKVKRLSKTKTKKAKKEPKVAAVA